MFFQLCIFIFVYTMTNNLLTSSKLPAKDWREGSPYIMCTVTYCQHFRLTGNLNQTLGFPYSLRHPSSILPNTPSIPCFPPLPGSNPQGGPLGHLSPSLPGSSGPCPHTLPTKSPPLPRILLSHQDKQRPWRHTVRRTHRAVTLCPRKATK